MEYHALHHLCHVQQTQERASLTVTTYVSRYCIIRCRRRRTCYNSASSHRRCGYHAHGRTASWRRCAQSRDTLRCRRRASSSHYAHVHCCLHMGCACCPVKSNMTLSAYNGVAIPPPAALARCCERCSKYPKEAHHSMRDVCINPVSQVNPSPHSSAIRSQ